MFSDKLILTFFSWYEVLSKNVDYLGALSQMYILVQKYCLTPVF